MKSYEEYNARPNIPMKMRRLTLKFKIKSEVSSQTSRLTLRFELELEGQPMHLQRYFGRAFYTTNMVSHYR